MTILLLFEFKQCKVCTTCFLLFEFKQYKVCTTWRIVLVSFVSVCCRCYFGRRKVHALSVSIYTFCILLPRLLYGILSFITSHRRYVCTASLNSADACWLHCMFTIQTSEQQGSMKKRCGEEIVAVCLEMLCYKQTVYVTCTALFSYPLLSYAGALSAWVLSNLLFLFLHASLDSERGKLFSFFHSCVYPSGMHWKIYWFACISEQKLKLSDKIHICHLFNLLLTELSNWYWLLVVLGIFFPQAPNSLIIEQFKIVQCSGF